MFITQFTLNKSRRHSRFLMANPQALHAAVLASFPPDSLESAAADSTRILWRLDGSTTRDDLYIVSPARPDLTGLVEDAGWPTQETWRTRGYQSRLDSIRLGQQWRFRLVANPTVSKKSGPGEKSRRVAHVTIEQQQDWLLKRAGGHGFEIAALDEQNTSEEVKLPNLQLSNSRVRKFRRENMTVTLSTAQYDGVLQVTDPIALQRSLVNGIGPAKGYGCGLLTLAPLGG
ncbi:type I-E CRISPR-associated protein Cas6/Cse3/CasE [Jonesiaceae bacterium BS-20]|uniref:Type I-E CRISPR-associated protein Cas6/Cse3/CasE n=1 Tax=Jonesiaceae bacterium BS-20 TaxID=3120821 RepID=A0AAU7DWB8_9MICO